jgi:hypothetical protein
MRYFLIILAIVVFIIAVGVVSGLLRLGISEADKLTVEKVITIKSQMDDICNIFGYYDEKSVKDIDKKYPIGARDSNPAMDVSCLDQDNASGMWPEKCFRGYIDYVLDAENKNAPGMSERFVNDFGNDWYFYSYKFSCNSN